MWIVRLALRRPYTFVVAALLVAILSIYMIMARMPTDIFPEINIPVISVIFNYGGMSPDDMEKRIVNNFERFATTTVNDIDHIDSQSLNGIGVIKLYFSQNAKIEVAIAQVSAISQTAIRNMPPGTQPPLIIQYNASDVPIIQLSVGSDTVPEQRLFDLATNTIRTDLTTIPNVEIPAAYGGKQRNIVVDLDPEKLFAYGISPSDVSSAINAQNLILPAGSTKIGAQEYQVRLNSSPEAVDALNNLPIKTVGGTTIYVRDIAHVRDGFAVQTNVVHSEGKRGVLISILKSGNGSTLDVVKAVKERLPAIQQKLDATDPGVVITPLFDQSVFVRASVQGVVKEAVMAAGLTALMILLFLGSWRSTLIVIVSIPLSILVGIIVLGFMGETLNVMTLGGMALAVGILVDDATVAIENIHRNLHMHKGLVRAILDGSQQIAVPAFVSTLCICIVFVPVAFISGAARYLFTPLALAVVFAMMTSYIISRTLVPTMINYLLPAEVSLYGGIEEGGKPRHEMRHPLFWFFVALGVALLVGGISMLLGMQGAAGMPAALAWIAQHSRTIAMAAFGAAATMCLVFLFVQGHPLFNIVFEKFRRFYGGLLDWSLDHRLLVSTGFLVLVVVSCGLFTKIGTDFFPSVDAGELRLHVRCPPGTRIEQTEQYFAGVEEAIRQVIPASETQTVLDNMGIPNSGINLSLSDGSVMSAADGEILISLNENHKPTADYMRALRKELPKRFPELSFFFAPSDIVTQVLNFGISAPVDIQVAGPPKNSPRNLAVVAAIRDEVVAVPGVVDAHMQQVPKTPDLRISVDRTLASILGVTQRDVAGDLLVSLSSSNQTAPNFWLNPATGINYSIYVQTPQYFMNSLSALQSTPIVPTGGPGATQLLDNLASTSRGISATNITHHQISPTYDLLLGVQGADLGSVAARLREIVERHQYDPAHPNDPSRLPGGSTIALQGQVQSMHDSFTGLGIGLIFSIVLVYLIMVINFQSWLDPFIILMALPGALAGILWMLWVTNTTISVPALMGAIMSIGVATANSILMITFANDQRLTGADARKAALAAGLTRLRPVVMTAAAMIIGMLPMALGLGEGGEQNAPLGRAVIGGLTMATFATLFFVPVVYTLLRGKPRKATLDPELQ